MESGKCAAVGLLMPNVAQPLA